jgi:hypothetical protein
MPLPSFAGLSTTGTPYYDTELADQKIYSGFPEWALQMMLFYVLSLVFASLALQTWIPNPTDLGQARAKEVQEFTTDPDVGGLNASFDKLAEDSFIMVGALAKSRSFDVLSALQNDKYGGSAGTLPQPLLQPL